MTGYTEQQFGNYHLIRLLGQSSLADVYLCEHIYLRKQAVIKVLSMRLVGNNLKNFLEEARTITLLEHPHIVRVFDFGVQNTIPYLVMDYMPNGTLRQHYLPGSVLPLTSIVSYVKDIAVALQYIHNTGIIHGNIKPENMLMGRDDDILLADLHLALPSQGLRYRGMQRTASAVDYIAPEQINGNPCPASDQYALAAIVYEWMSGNRLFYGSFTELCDQHLHTSPPLLEKAPEFSSAVEEVLFVALAKDANKRFGTVQAFADA